MTRTEDLPRGELLAGHPNLRDLGGLPAADGRRVARRRFLRGPALFELSDADAPAAAELDLAHVVDFRGEQEAALRPARVDAPRTALSIEPSAARRLMEVFQRGTPRPAEVSAVMEETYRDFVRVHADIFARFLSLAATVETRPILFHCTAGKDRTGLAAALLLTALDVPREAIREDYLRSNDLWRPDPQIAAAAPSEVHAALFGVAPSYLDAALEELDRAHGGPAAFAEAAMGGASARRAWADRHLAG